MAEPIEVAIGDLSLDRNLPRGTKVTYEGQEYVIDGERHHSNSGAEQDDPDEISYILVPVG